MIIQWLIAIIALLSLALMVFWVKGRRFQEGGEIFPDMEGTLRRILEGLQDGSMASSSEPSDNSSDVVAHEKAQGFEKKKSASEEADSKDEIGSTGIPEAESSEAANQEQPNGGANSEELQSLQKLLEDSQNQVRGLEEKLKAIESQAQKSNDSELKAKIADLEGKLAEYEIIEDDIADLSRLKEENESLKADLVLLKEQIGAPSSETSETSEPKIESKTEGVEDAAQDPVVAADETAPTQEATTEPSGPDDSLNSIEDAFASDDLVQELDAALSEESSSSEEPEPVEALLEEVVGDSLGEAEEETKSKSTDQEEIEPESVEASVDAIVSDPDESLGAPVAAGPMATGNQPAADSSAPQAAEDLFAEFSADKAKIVATPEEKQPSNASEPKTASKEVVGEESLEAVDTEKMLEEMGDLAELNTSSTESALEDEMDVDKMAAEALSLGGEDR
jgi:hypothetical protein